MIMNKKGFTLIEIIVVLIIIGIMAAAGIPAMVGLIDTAKGKSLIVEARVGFAAAQAIFVEFYGQDLDNISGELVNVVGDENGMFSGAAARRFDNMVSPDLTGDVLATEVFEFRINPFSGQITELVYTNAGYRVIIRQGQPADIQKFP